MPADPKYRCSQVLGSSSGSGPCSLARRTSARQDHANTICRHHGFRTTVATICLHTPNPHPKQLHVRWNCCWLSSGTCRVRLASSGPFPFSLLPVAVLLVRSPMCAFVFFSLWVRASCLLTSCPGNQLPLQHKCLSTGAE